MLGIRVTMLKPSGSLVSAPRTTPRRVIEACGGRCAAEGRAHTSSEEMASAVHLMRSIIGYARGESRTLMGLPPTDFESVASAIPPLGPAAKYSRGGWPRCLVVALARQAAATQTRERRRRDTHNP